MPCSNRSLTVTRTRALGPDLFGLWLEAGPALLAARPGQFLHVRVGDGLLRRPISVWHVTATEVALFVREVGQGTRWMARLRPGDALDVLGPLGTPFTPARPGERVLLVGGGVGVAPLAHFAQLHAGTAVLAARLGFRNGASVCGLEPFAAAGVPVEAFVDGEPGPGTQVGRPTAGLEAAIRRFRPDRLLTCGPDPLMASAARVSAEHGVRCEASLERPMGCGIGVCLACAVEVTGPDGTRRFVRGCTEGPVLDAATVYAVPGPAAVLA